MPELPEMENYKQLLVKRIQNSQITNVIINREKSINVTPAEFLKRVTNQRLNNISRRAKYLLFYLESGDILLLHLMLGGLMYYGTEEDKPDRTVQIQLSFGQQQLYFIGLRLGYLHIYTETEVEQELSDLGPEPLNINFSLDAFNQLIGDKRGVLKATLVDQQFLSGIGNRYSDEICWHAKLLPTRQVNELSRDEVIQLYKSLRFVLQKAIQHGGYIEQPLFKNDTKTGKYLPLFYVYKQEGKKCKRCNSSIVRDEVASKKTFYCPTCQK